MGAVTAAVIGAGTAIYGASQAKKQQKAAAKQQQQQMEALDPFAKYRPQYADKLTQLTNDPSSIEGTAAYKARLRAAERTMAAQGYTGSGNANWAAADAASAAYQQEFDNLAMLSGATQGQSARSSAYSTGADAQSNANDSYLSGIAGIGNNLSNLATIWGNRANNVNTTVVRQSVPVFNPGISF